jgi:hypothetical protein
MDRTRIILGGLLGVLPVVLGAQTMPAPRPAERLAVFEGEWISADASGAVATRDTCAWLEGARRHMSCRRRTDTPSGAREQLLVYSYRGSDSTYTVTVFLTGGQVWHYAGRVDGERWTFDLVSPVVNAAVRIRQVVRTTPDSLHFVEEVSENGGPWRLTDPSEDYRMVRQRSTRSMGSRYSDGPRLWRILQ